jgi:hypothetical protein
MSLLSGCTVQDNAGDGVRYVHHDREYLSDRSDIFDFCTFPTTTRTASQTFPIQVTLEQSQFSTLKKDCHKVSCDFQGRRNFQIIPFNCQLSARFLLVIIFQLNLFLGISYFPVKFNQGMNFNYFSGKFLLRTHI